MKRENKIFFKDLLVIYLFLCFGWYGDAPVSTLIFDRYFGFGIDVVHSLQWIKIRCRILQEVPFEISFSRLSICSLKLFKFNSLAIVSNWFVFLSFPACLETLFQLRHIVIAANCSLWVLGF